MAEPAFERIAFVASRYPTLRDGLVRLALHAWTAPGLIDLSILCQVLPRNPDGEAVSFNA